MGLLEKWGVVDTTIVRSHIAETELFQYLNKKLYEINLKNKSISTEEMKKMAGKVGEHLVANLVNGKVVEEEGFDIIVQEETKLQGLPFVLYPGKTIEVKTQVYRTSGKCTAYSLSNKEEKCDYVALVDMTGCKGKEKIFIIPSNIFFGFGHFNGKNERFSWSGSYNKSDKIMVENTNLILDFEVTNA